MTPKEKEIYEKTKKLNPKQLAFAHEYILRAAALLPLLRQLVTAHRMLVNMLINY